MHVASTVRRAATLAAGFVGLYAQVGCSKAPQAPPASLADLARGAMAKLQVTTSPRPAPATPFADAAGKMHTLAEFRGKALLVNVWANWCAPCKAEIPSLARLAVVERGQPVAIAPVSVGKGEDEAAGRRFIERNPPLVFYSEPTYALAFAVRPPIAGMPTTILYDRRGVERARLVGGADWSGPEARAVMDYLVKN